LLIPRLYRLAQIVLTVKPDATAAGGRRDSQEGGRSASPGDAAESGLREIAKKNSQDPQSAEKGGDVGWLREPDMMPSVREGVSGLTENGVSQPVRVPDGWQRS